MIKNNTEKGTYVGLRVLDPASSLLYQHCLDANIPVTQSLFERRLHTTVIFSRVYCPNITAQVGEKHIAKVKGYDVFTTETGSYALVLRLDAPSVVARHNKLMQDHGASYDYPVFHPHITLTYKYDSPVAVGLPKVDFDIILGEEYAEDLNLSWVE